MDESPFFSYLLEGITNSAVSLGYTMNFIYLNSSMSLSEQRYMLVNSDCKGFLVFGVEMAREDLTAFKDTEIPFVVLDNVFQTSDVDCIGINNKQGINYALRYLYENGHRKIGYIRSKIRINSFESRYRQYKRVLKELGLEYKEGYVVDAGYSETEAEGDMEVFLQTAQDLHTAFLAENDFLAASVLRGIENVGYRVPDDFSLIGFDDRPIASITSPSLTTVNIPKEVFGPQGVKMLVNRIETDRTQSLLMEVGTNLIERESVKNITHQKL